MWEGFSLYTPSRETGFQPLNAYMVIFIWPYICPYMAMYDHIHGYSKIKHNKKSLNTDKELEKRSHPVSPRTCAENELP